MDSQPPGERMIVLSLVVATVGNPALVRALLVSLAAQRNAPAFEVVLVDQSDDDQLLAVAAEFADAITIVHERMAQRGASRARNVGAGAARGTWLGFPDDDCEFLPDALEQLARWIAKPDVSLVTGRTTDFDGRPNLARWPEEGTRIDPWSMFGRFTETTLFVERQLFLSSGGFDERFGPGTAFPAAEGIDLMNRLLPRAAAGSAVYEPRVTLRHPTKIPPWNKWAADRFYDYAIGAGAAIAKCPQPHMLHWGVRILLSAALALWCRYPWRSVAYLSRIRGLWHGWMAFRALDRKRVPTPKADDVSK